MQHASTLTQKPSEVPQGGLASILYEITPRLWLKGTVKIWKQLLPVPSRCSGRPPITEKKLQSFRAPGRLPSLAAELPLVCAWRCVDDCIRPPSFTLRRFHPPWDVCFERTDLLQQRWTDCPWGNSAVHLSHPAPALSVSSEFSVLPTEPGYPVCPSKDLSGGHSHRAEPHAWGQAPLGCVLTGRQDTWHPSHSPLLRLHLYFPFVNSLYLDVTSSSVSC